MNDIIHLLPDSVANQIAAGEVVQRPSSIVKELVENSIDAGAKNIQILVVDGGKSNVQVIDDGKGMSEADARLSFERHATSKISQATDLFRLTTMGFRGEALASIAAVAQVELITRREEDELGTCVRISGSKLESQEPLSCSVGCNMSVRNLFYNIPARRKFLKSNQAEQKSIEHVFNRIVLVYPDISFSMYNNGTELSHLPKSGVRQRIVDVFGKKINSDLLPIEVETSLVSVSGYISKPEASKKKEERQFFFVNGRYMRHSYFHNAVMHAYENLIPAGDTVMYFIYIDVDPSAIDVNVHPTKTEVKFDNEPDIWKVLSAAVKETLGKFCNVPLIDFDVEGKPDIPVFPADTYNGGSYAQPKQHYASYNPFKSGGGNSAGVSGWQSLYDDKESMNSPLSSLESSSFNEDEMQFDYDKDLYSTADDSQNASLFAEGTAKLFNPSLPVLQFRLRYLAFPSDRGIVVVDQKRAHICVQYEKYRSRLLSADLPCQKVLFPEVVQFSPAESVIIEGISEELTKLGFDIVSLGGYSYSVSGLPAELSGMNATEVLRDLVTSFADVPHEVVEEVHRAIAVSLAKTSSISYGKSLSQVEIINLLQELFSLSSFLYTPDGKKVYSIVENKAIDKLFN